MLGVISFHNFGCLVFYVEFINFRPGRDFINVRGLLIQGGDLFVEGLSKQIVDCLFVVVLCFCYKTKQYYTCLDKHNIINKLSYPKQ